MGNTSNKSAGQTGTPQELFGNRITGADAEAAGLTRHYGAVVWHAAARAEAQVDALVQSQAYDAKSARPTTIDMGAAATQSVVAGEQLGEVSTHA